MSKKMKLNLEELEVQSFVTALEGDATREVRGGFEDSIDASCGTCHLGCDDPSFLYWCTRLC